tara:strand:- start:342 stop:1796 length:1455 start_codon:yes stop_codon:yes gene_type:complete
MFAQSLNTVSLNVEIDDSQIVNAELSSLLDDEYNTHIAWIKSTDTAKTVMYSIFDGNNVVTKEIKSYQNAGVGAPQIVLDESGGPHIVYFLKRDVDGSSYRTGNYAVMYAGDSNRDMVFEQSQVSTNSENPEDDIDNEFNSYVNGRPSITVGANGSIVVTYLSDSSNETDYDNYLIQAELSGNTWNRSSLFNTDEFVQGIYNVTEGFASPQVDGDSRYVATIDLSDYRPQFFIEKNGEWSKTVLEEFSGTFNNRNIHLYTDNENKTHMMWFHDGTDADSFAHTILDGNSYSTPELTAVKNNPGGNLFGYAIDKTLGDTYYFYGKSFSDDGYLISFDENGLAIETELRNVGEVFGKRTMHVNNGYISLVTASEDDQKIYITNGVLGQPVSVEDDKVQPFAFSLSQNYPNPFNPESTIQFSIAKSVNVKLEVFNLVGQNVATLVNKKLSAGYHTAQFDANGLSSGIYIYRIQAEGFIQTKKMLLIK